MTEPTTIVFLGTPDFACPFLESLAADPQNFRILAVITQEDKPQGRKKLLTPPPVKVTAQKLGLPVYQPPRLNKDIALLEKLESLQPDFLLVIAYGQILSRRVLDIAKIKAINVHGSILPRYRGASPIEQALFNGDSETGLSIMAMDEGMDTGPVYSEIRCPISPGDTSPLLRNKLAELGAAKLPQILLQIKEDKLQPIPQDNVLATYCQKISRDDGKSTPAKESAITIYNRWRAYFPWPGVTVEHKGVPIKLVKIKPATQPRDDNATHIAMPGTFVVRDKQILLICQNGALEILELQIPGKTIQNAASFLSGHQNYFS
jgi:methionyl-tRNA formyltransferase